MRRSLLVIVLLLLIILGALGFARSIALQRIHEPYWGHSADHVLVHIKPGATARAIAEKLERVGIVEDAATLVLWLRWNGQASGIHMGEYRFSGPVTLAEVAEILVQGRVHLRSVTVPEGSTRWQVAEAIERWGFGPRADVLTAIFKVGFLEGTDDEAETLEGYLFPDTYLAPSGLGADEIIGMMVRRFGEMWTSERRQRAGELGLSLREVVILASLVEAETTLQSELRLVSAVFHNRLERGMLLQCDPTLLYALSLAGRTDRNIRRDDFVLDSPYNTYRYFGLPVGPIGNPGMAALDAALWPADTDYLYFVARNDGSHAFTRTLAEHNRMVNRYQR